MKVQLHTAAWYGDVPSELEFPDTWEVRELAPELPRPLNEPELRRAIEHPIAQRPLRDFARGATRPLIVVDDLTRPTPTDRVLPHVLSELQHAGIFAHRVTVLVAIGAHGAPSEDALRRKLGSSVERVNVLVHDMMADLEYAGRTSFGTPVDVNRAVVESDFVLGIGGVYPQHSIGMGGGSKLLLGVLGRRSITALHYGHESMEGQYSIDNSFRRDLDEIARLLRLRTMVLLHVDARRQIVRAVAGDPCQIYADAARFSVERFTAPRTSDADVVISNAYPMDISMTFARSKGMGPLFRLAPNVSRIAVAACPEGMGCHRLFPFTRHTRFGADFRRRVAAARPGEIPHLVATRVLRRFRNGRGPHRNPVWIYTPACLQELPSGFIASQDWPAILEHVKREQGGRTDLRATVYACAPLQVLTE